MTAQVPETLLYEGEELSMCAEPLGRYFVLTGLKPNFRSNCIALWRGYVGTWEILERRLYLVKLQGTTSQDKEVSIATLFPDFPDRVFAHWFSGTIRVPQGKLLEYVHMGYGSKYERDLLFEIERGVVKNIELRQNDASDIADDEEGYRIDVATVFSQQK